MEGMENELPSGQLLGAIVAHEMGNPFTALTGRVEMLCARSAFGPRTERDLKALRGAGVRMARILKNLKRLDGERPTHSLVVKKMADFSAPFDLILSLAEGLEQRSEADEIGAEDRGALKEMRKASTQLGRILDDLKSFAQGATQWPESVEVEEVLRPALTAFADVTVEWPQEPVIVKAEPARLAGAVRVVLAAMAARPGTSGPCVLSFPPSEENDEVLLNFVFEGPPLSEAERDALFHPFGGGGLGWPAALGLSYAYYAIRGWGGSFRFLTGERASLTLVLTPP